MLNRVLLVHVLSSILPFMLLPLLEREGVFCAQTRLHQEIYKMAAGSAAIDRNFGIEYEGSNPSTDLVVFV